MPTYEYECKACKHHFSAFQNMKDAPLKTCPECKEDKLKRLLGAGAGLIFKGSGFYCTDYKSPSHDRASKAAPKSEAKAETPKKDKPAST